MNNVHESDSEELAWKMDIEVKWEIRCDQVTVKPETPKGKCV